MYCRIVLLFVLARTVCSAIVFECTFESDSCGFSQSQYGNYGLKWERIKGMPEGTSKYLKCCAKSDHTTGSGYYFNCNARNSRTANAYIQAYRNVNIPNKDNVYMRLYYNMWNEIMPETGTFKVSVGGTAIFSKTGNQGNGWKRAEIKITKSGSQKITFEAKRAGSPYGDIAFDDVTIAEYYKANTTNMTATATEMCWNDYVILECNPNGFPEADLTFFFKEGQQLPRGNNAYKSIRVRSTIAGNHTYRCSPSNEVFGQAPNQTITITTHALPTVSNPPGRVDVNEGSKVNLVCNATGTGPFTVVWRKKYSSQAWTSKNYTIESASASSDHYSKFTCTVTDANGCKKTSPETLVYVNYKPKNTNIYTSAGTICETGKISLRCYASARPSVNEYRFILNGQVVQVGSSINKQNTYTAGSYNWTCSAKNTVGFGPNATREIIIKAPPNITWISDNQTFAEGSRVIISCNVTGSNPMTITWKKVGSSSSLGNGPNLILENVTTADIGGYQCTASNGGECATATSRPSYLYVVYKPKDTNLTMSTNSTLCLDDLISLECTADADPPAHQYLIYVNDELLETFNTTRISFNTSIAGNNTYRCHPKNSVGLGENASILINTKAPPNITWITPNQSTPEKFKTVVMCNVTGSEPMNIEWRKARSSSNSLLSIETNLTFNYLMRKHEGTYECTASNGNECPIMQSTTSINVLYEPTVNIVQRSLTLEEKDILDLICTYDGNPKPNITWSRDNVILSYNEKLIIPAQKSEPGLYKCTASNGIGNDQTATTNVIVNVCRNECKNNATCLRTGTTFRCSCRRGFRERFCQTVDVEAEKFNVKLVLISVQWKEDLKDSASDAFKSLQKDICSEMRKTFGQKMRSCKLLQASKGSVITTTELVFNGTKMESEVMETLANATTNGTLGALKIKVSAGFNVSAQIEEDDACARKPCNFDGKCIAKGTGYKCDCKLFRFGDHCQNGLGLAAGIITIILCCIAVALIIFAIVFCWRCVSKKDSYKSEMDSRYTTDINMGSFYVKNEDHIDSKVNPGFNDYNYNKKSMYQGSAPI